ncbi:precorrin-2 dehydrogenase [Geoalkalibacter ferrihydriticus]|uniref:precorrin-2 dehydrogenase n=1 Tax=Geoalkalibacter ferrihydriticus TaxID=392333 RepID=A0A1G9VIB0_9BACT|nr:NAD(P)-dependent oxidoreductase [Geoalkalibacter ferrihydriticus]SDM71840.1 precorrin-2 dehydrogenase [Geoalkalibacter ferrihydriticus]
MALSLVDRLCVVIGAGAVGRRKVQGLRAAGARVRVVDARQQALGGLEGVEVVARPYGVEDVAGALLVFAATADAGLNRCIVEDARAAGALAQAVDDPQGSDFHLPALARRGDLTLAVYTGGRSPALAAAVRDLLSLEFGPEWATVLELAAALRQKRLTGDEATSYNHNVLPELLSGGLAALVAAGDSAAVEQLLQQVAGKNVTLECLGISLPKGLK